MATTELTTGLAPEVSTLPVPSPRLGEASLLVVSDPLPPHEPSLREQFDHWRFGVQFMVLAEIAGRGLEVMQRAQAIGEKITKLSF